MKRAIDCVVLLLVMSLAALAQEAKPAPKPQAKPQAKPQSGPESQGVRPALQIWNTTPFDRPLSKGLLYPFRCDEKENIYIRQYEVETSGRAAIEKYDKDGRLKARLSLVNSGLKDPVGYGVFVAQDGTAYQLAGETGGEFSYVVTFKSDGTTKSVTKLQRSSLSGSLIAVFPSGEFLVTGIDYPPLKSPPEVKPKGFTGIYDANGRLLKALEIERDPGTAEIRSQEDQRTVSLGDAAAAKDGNVYLMRRSFPTVIYALSPAGEVVRTLEISIDEPRLTASSLHVSGTQAAVLFSELHQGGGDGQVAPAVVKIIDLAGGAEIAAYDVPRPLGSALACYSPEYFTFVSWQNGTRILMRAVGQ